MNTVSNAPALHDLETVRAPAARHDIYAEIHKALRKQMVETLVRVGRIDLSPGGNFEAVVADVQTLLEGLRSHLKHENDFIHAAIEARRPGFQPATVADHVEHLREIDALQADLAALQGARGAQRSAQAQRLYRHLAVFVAENLRHMNVEETVNNDLLWTLYSDDEIAEIHERLRASIPPAEMMTTLGNIVAALAPHELEALLFEISHTAPPPVFDAVLDLVRSKLETPRWSRLASALGVPQVPGLVQMAL